MSEPPSKNDEASSQYSRHYYLYIKAQSNEIKSSKPNQILKLIFFASIIQKLLYQSLEPAYELKLGLFRGDGGMATMVGVDARKETYLELVLWSRR